MLIMSVTHQCTNWTNFFKITSLTNQIKLFIRVYITKKFYLWRGIFCWTLYSERWRFLKLSFFNIFSYFDNTYVFRNILTSTFTNYCLRLTIWTCEYFAISFDFKRKIDTFFTKSMPAFWYYSGNTVISVVLKFTNRTWRHVTFIFCCAVQHEIFSKKEKFKFLFLILILIKTNVINLFFKYFNHHFYISKLLNK